MILTNLLDAKIDHFVAFAKFRPPDCAIGPEKGELPCVSAQKCVLLYD